MRRRNIIAPAACLLGLSTAFAAQPLATLYRGQTAKESGIVLGGWGSGMAREVSDEVLNGTRSLLVDTDGYYSGARIDFTQPIDLSRYANTAGAAFRFDIKSINDVAPSDGGLAPGGGYFFQGPPIGPGMPGMPGMPGRAGMPAGQPDEQPATSLAIQNVRVILFSGTTSVAAVDQTVDPEDRANGWIHVRVPLAAFKANGGGPANWSGFRLNRLLLMGDAPDTFYVGEIDLIQTDLSITEVSAGDDQEIYEGDTADFMGTAANSAGLQFSWDFDATDGIQQDAIGHHVTYRYRKAGTYTATLTVSDPTGARKPVSKTVQVKVNG